jgi:hypothetical protein
MVFRWRSTLPLILIVRQNEKPITTYQGGNDMPAFFSDKGKLMLPERAHSDDTSALGTLKTGGDVQK